MLEFLKECDQKLYKEAVELEDLLHVKKKAVYVQMRGVIELSLNTLYLEYLNRTRIPFNTTLNDIIHDGDFKEYVDRKTGFRDFNSLDEFCRLNGNRAAHFSRDHNDEWNPVSQKKGFKCVFEFSRGYYKYYTNTDAPAWSDEEYEKLTKPDTEDPKVRTDIDKLLGKVLELSEGFGILKKGIIDATNKAESASKDASYAKAAAGNAANEARDAREKAKAADERAQNAQKQARSADSIARDANKAAADANKTATDASKTATDASKEAKRASKIVIENAEKEEIRTATANTVATDEKETIRSGEEILRQWGASQASPNIGSLRKPVGSGSFEENKQIFNSQGSGINTASSIISRVVLSDAAGNCPCCKNTVNDHTTEKVYAFPKMGVKVVIVSMPMNRCNDCGISFLSEDLLRSYNQILETHYQRKYEIDYVDKRNVNKIRVKREMTVPSTYAKRGVIEELNATTAEEHRQAIRYCQEAIRSNDELYEMALLAVLQAGEFVENERSHIRLLTENVIAKCNDDRVRQMVKAAEERKVKLETEYYTFE